MAIRINFNVTCNTSNDEIARNLKKTDKYKRLKWGTPLSLPPAAIVGGGPGVKSRLEMLREWPGDIYAVNDMAGYLSDEGIPCYLYSIDCSRHIYRTGSLVKGALFASRCNKKQFIYDNIRIFDMAEDYAGGMTGGPTGICRTPLLMLRMGYRQVHYFGCEGSFVDLFETHVSGMQKVAHDNMIIVRSGENEYLTNASLYVQSEHMAERLQKFPLFLVNQSDGLLRSMLMRPDDYEVKAIAQDLKKQLERKGTNKFTKEYIPGRRDVICQQPQAI